MPEPTTEIPAFSADEIAAMRVQHGTDHPRDVFCRASHGNGTGSGTAEVWPCREARFLATLDAALDEIQELRSIYDELTDLAKRLGHAPEPHTRDDLLNWVDDRAGELRTILGPMAPRTPVTPEIRRVATTSWTVLDLPNWTPLENVLSLSDCALFMYMGTVTLADGTTVEQYKHRNTRRYLNLDAERQAYRITYEGGDPFTEGATSEQGWAETIALAEAIEFAQS